MKAVRGVLQLDFDGTLVEGDVSTGILARFAGPQWRERVEAASLRLVACPDSPDLIDAMVAGFADLGGLPEDHLRFAREHHRLRPGLSALIQTAERLGLDCHIVSNGFEFYILDYVRAAGVAGRVAVHCGTISEGGRLVYAGPEGLSVRAGFKRLWAEHFMARHRLLVYAGDGTSDLDAARLVPVVFARDSLLTHMQSGFAGELRAFETLHDITEGLEQLLG
jgi:2-hydroxy-3-keto-5-methylthiopentenyl-1-phosphate phosphatase